MVNIHWYPGHMTKAFRVIEESLKLVDACVELRDARIPVSSANPKIDEIISSKPRVILLNKTDMADDKATKSWIDYFASINIKAIPIEAVTGKGLKSFQTALRAVTLQKKQHYLSKGIKSFTIRAMILGIPNVGKSTLINTINKSKVARTADRPGVTRGKQWIKVANDLELMDLPGVLWPKIEDQTSAKYLAFTGCIKDDAIDKQAMVIELAAYLYKNYRERLMQRYKITEADVDSDTIALDSGMLLLEKIAKKRGLLISKGRCDCNRAGEMLLNDFRDGKLGKFTLESCSMKLNLKEEY